jgi:hypothetical protein
VSAVRGRDRRGIVASIAAAALAACAATPEVRHAPLEQRLERLEAKLVAGSKAPPAISSEDRRFLESRGIATEGYAPADLAVIVALERFDATLSEDDLPALEAFGLSPEGRTLGFGIVRILAERRRFDGAAQVLVATLSGREEVSSAAFAQWWELGFRGRPDYEPFTREFASALRRLGETGTPEQCRIVEALLAPPPVTPSRAPPAPPRGARSGGGGASTTRSRARASGRRRSSAGRRRARRRCRA